MSSEVEPPASTARWISALFMIGSSCFAVASVPALAKVMPAEVIGGTYFVGSVFFTSAAFLVSRVAWQQAIGAKARSAEDVGRSLDVWAAIIQFAGTLWFNINTFHALEQNLSTRQENLRIWTPDFLGSICFLVSSYLSILSVCGRPWCFRRSDREWRATALNLLGSVFFMLSALAAYTRPSTGDLLDASLANTGTLLGAVCFFRAAHLSWPSRTTSVDPERMATE